MVDVSTQNNANVTTPSPPPSVKDKLALALSPFFFAVAVIVSKIALNNGIYVHTFNALRNSIAFLLSCVFQGGRKTVGEATCIMNCTREAVFWSVLCGVSNAMATVCSAVALAHLNTAMFSFMLGLSVVMTPLLGHFLPFKCCKLQPLGWFAVILSIIGTLVLEGCVGNRGDCFVNGNWYTIAALSAALFYSLYSYLIGLGSETVESNMLTQGALGVSSLILVGILLISVTLSIATNNHGSEGSSNTFLVYFYVTSRQLLCVVAVSALEAVAWQYETFAVIALGSSKSAMAIATEAPMTTLLAYVILNESLTTSEYMGCILVFLAAVIASHDGVEDTSEHCESTDIRGNGSDSLSYSAHSMHGLLPEWSESSIKL